MLDIAVRTLSHFSQDKQEMFCAKRKIDVICLLARAHQIAWLHALVFFSSSLSFFLLSALSSCSAATGLTILVLYTLLFYWSSGTYICTGKHDRGARGLQFHCHGLRECWEAWPGGARTAIPLAMVCVSAHEAILQSASCYNMCEAGFANNE